MPERCPLDSPTYTRRRHELRRALNAVRFRLAQAQVAAAEARELARRMTVPDLEDTVGPGDLANLVAADPRTPKAILEFAENYAPGEDAMNGGEEFSGHVQRTFARFGAAILAAVILASSGCATPAPAGSAYGSHEWTQNTCAACGAADDSLQASEQCPRARCTCFLGGVDRSSESYTDPADCAAHGARFEQ